MCRTAALLLLVACGAARAQEPAPVDLGAMQVTAGRVEETVEAIPQAVTVVDRDQIEKAVPQVMTDLLRGQPGVFLQSSGPGQGIAIIRGLKGSEVLHLVDGMRLNMTFFRNSPSQYVALVDPLNIDRIEVLRGPGATLYGSDAMGGVLHVLTPESRFAGDAWSARGSTLVRLGSADLAKIGRVQGAAGNADLSVAGGFTYQDFGERDTGGGGRQPASAYSARGADGKVLWTPSAGHEWMLSTQWLEMPKLPRHHESVCGFDALCTSRNPVFFEPSARAFAHARYRRSAPLAFADALEVHLAQQVIDDDRSRLVDAGTDTREREENRSRLTGLTLQGTTGHAGGHYVYGIDLYRDTVSSAKWRTVGGGPAAPRSPTFPDGAEEDSGGVFLNGEWRLTDPLLLDAGIRYSRVRTDLPATAVSAAAEVNNDDVTGHLGTSLRLVEDLYWTANLARGFRAPNIFDLGTLGPRPGSSPQQINVPNPELEPETVVSADTGFKWRTGAARFETAVFGMRYHDRIESREPTGILIPDGTLGCSTPAGCPEVRSENISRAQYWGVEAGARLETRPIGAYATLNYTWGEERRAGGQAGPANRVPPLSGVAGVEYAPGGVWAGEAYVLFADDQSRLDDDDRKDSRINPAGTGGWGSVNVRFGWTSGATRVQLLVSNLFDKAYREHGSGIDAPGVGATLTLEQRFE